MSLSLYSRKLYLQRLIASFILLSPNIRQIKNSPKLPLSRNKNTQKKSPNHLPPHSDNSLKIKTNAFPCVFPVHCLPHAGQYHILTDQVADIVITWQSWHKDTPQAAFPTQLGWSALGTAQCEPKGRMGWGCSCQPWAFLAPQPSSCFEHPSAAHTAPHQKGMWTQQGGGWSQHPKTLYRLGRGISHGRDWVRATLKQSPSSTLAGLPHLRVNVNNYQGQAGERNLGLSSPSSEQELCLSGNLPSGSSPLLHYSIINSNSYYIKNAQQVSEDLGWKMLDLAVLLNDH